MSQRKDTYGKQNSFSTGTGRNEPKRTCRKLGISPGTLNGYEKGNHDPKSAGLIEIAKACNVTTDYLLGLSDNIEKLQFVPVSKAMPGTEAIIEKANKLNSDGLSRLNEYADDLVASGKYKKAKTKEDAR